MILDSKKITNLNQACNELSKLEEVRHVGVINRLGHLIVGGLKEGLDPLVDEEKIRMIYMQLQLDFQMRKELDDILGPIDYIASRRKKLLIISVPVQDHLIIITAKPDSDDKKIIKKAEELFDEIHLS
ncbi:MAG TPA: DUF6659 family protein [Nitrosopumilaceae archaeon]|nr:DUF6659 family protein [Nitrosopumilaceae archaeon]